MTCAFRGAVRVNTELRMPTATATASLPDYVPDFFIVNMPSPLATFG